MCHFDSEKVNRLKANWTHTTHVCSEEKKEGLHKLGAGQSNLTRSAVDKLTIG